MKNFHQRSKNEINYKQMYLIFLLLLNFVKLYVIFAMIIIHEVGIVR